MKRLLVLLALAALIPAPDGGVLLAPKPAFGQQQSPATTERRSFFDVLFGRRARPAEPDRSREDRRSRTGTKARTAAPPVAVAKILPKEETALKVLVVGDFVSGAVARGLDQTFAAEARVAIINASNGNSGLVRDDYYDWGKLLPDLLNAEQPDVIVIAIGSNDRQQIKSDGARYAPLSEDWEKVYSTRIEGIAETLKVYDRPFFWMGSPPMRSGSFSRDMVYLNGLYKTRVTEAGGYFVDIWNGFTNADGRFVSSGPDVDGNLRALRTKDGINFTRAGRLKLAFYVEREMKRQIGFSAGSADVLLMLSTSSQIEIGPDGVKRLVGPIVSLSGPRPGAREALAGDVYGDIQNAGFGSGRGATPSDTETPHQLMVIKGGSLPRVPGRVDDFTWPPPRMDVAPEVETVGPGSF